MPSFLSISDACLAHLQRKDLFKTVLPSKIFESAAMRKAIVLGVEGCAADLVRRAGAGVCLEPENAEQLAAAVEMLDADPGLRQTYGESGHDHITQHFDRDRLSTEYLQLIARTTNIPAPAESLPSRGRPHAHPNSDTRRKPLSADNVRDRM